MFPRVSPKARSRQCMLSQETILHRRASVSALGAGVFRKHLGCVVASAVKDRWGVQGEEGTTPFPHLAQLVIWLYPLIREVCRGRVSLALHSPDHQGQLSP